MSGSKEVRFTSPNRRRETVSSRFERNENNFSTPRNTTNTYYKPRNLDQCDDITDGASRSLINNYRLIFEHQDTDAEQEETFFNYERFSNTLRRRNTKDTDSRRSRSRSQSEAEEEEEEFDDDEDGEDIDDNDEETESDSDDICSENNETALRQSLASLDRNCKKIVYGRDLLQIYYSFANWFNNLKDAFSPKASETTVRCENNNSSGSGIRRIDGTRTGDKNRNLSSSSKQTTSAQQQKFPQPSSHSTPKSNTAGQQKFNSFTTSSSPKPTTTTTNSPSNTRCPKKYNDPCDITGDLTRDTQLTLRYQSKMSDDCSKPWHDSMICKYVKYNNLMTCKCNFNDALSTWPGIGRCYRSRLSSHIPNVGTLVELYLSVDESTFKSLVQAYGRVNNFSLNLIYTTCKAYVRKYGFTFNDVIVAR